MGVLRTAESRAAEVEEFIRAAVACAGLNRRKDDDGFRKGPLAFDVDAEDQGTLVCVTCGASYLGMALANQLLLRGYSVRIAAHSSDDMDKLKEMESSEEMKTKGHFQIVMAKLNDVESLQQAFQGCRGVFHTSAFTDPAGLSGYTKSMAEIEVMVTENVMEACAKTTSVKRCVVTSSLSACLWQDNAQSESELSPVINHGSWSSDPLCFNKKLWYALGKMRAEKTAWEIASKRGLKLTTICPALITGPEFFRKNPTATIAYLKGAQEMYSHGLLATVDVTKLAEAHVCVFKAMNKNGYGRYICFENVIDSQTGAEKLAKEIGMPIEKICGDESHALHRFQLSNEKLCRLMAKPLRCYSEY
ncbi:cinnamoyl-CoA reductase-like SNL6 [Senna tora]|uniref:Cinnamoyl-CoA reductase-like SNL6 n=1 Tax=Senna tora TaxID=362788 RepID=A0A834WG23_9FABA|nr:cinnamoyl-CoA reductase-like SNL6 [Senna tora]